MIAEVLSPSTEAYDRGPEIYSLPDYRISSEYALVSQSEARVELFSRQADGRWLLSEFVGLEAICKFESLDCAVALSDIYHNVEFDQRDGDRDEAGSTYVK